MQFTDGTRASYDLVVGADGANSKIRDLVFGTESKPKYTGQTVWRATVSRPAEVQARCAFFGPRNKAGFNPVSRHGDVHLPRFRICRASSDFLTISCPETMREQLNGFRRTGRRSARTNHRSRITSCTAPFTSHLLFPPWGRRRVGGIGDAAHTTTPQMAAGAGACRGKIPWFSLTCCTQSVSCTFALEKFMTRRFERCRMVVDNSFQLGEWEKNPQRPRRRSGRRAGQVLSGAGAANLENIANDCVGPRRLIVFWLRRATQ